jgi:hypothetical protein
MQLTKESLLNGRNRRNFMKSMGIAAVSLGAAATVENASAQSSTFTDFDILNFALNLEYLEAEFYSYATTGAGIDAQGISFAGVGNTGPTTGGALVTFTDTEVQRVAIEIAQDELTHVAFLQSTITALGGSPIAKPAINLNALGIGFGSQAEFLTLARAFEDVGVTAYAGAAPLLVSKTVLSYAARILAVEAEHVGNIRLLIDKFAIPTTALDSADVLPPPSGSHFFSTNAQALVEVRSPQEVLFIAYAAPNVSSGGFFPSGVNGFFTASDTGSTGDLTTLTASPNPIPVSAGQDGVTTISWNAPVSSVIEVHIGSPTGALFSRSSNHGAMETGAWVTDGTLFYLQDVSVGPASPANTLAVLTVNLQTTA